MLNNIEEIKNKIFNEDCVSSNLNEGMSKIPDKSIDLILCDLPYGMTSRNKWDEIIPFEKLWTHYDRILKDNGAVLLFGDEPFTSMIVVSNPKTFKQRITWDKIKSNGFLNAKKMLMKQTEDVCLFYKKPPTYNPQMTVKEKGKVRPPRKVTENNSTDYGEVKAIQSKTDTSLKYPTNLIQISSMSKECNPVNRMHPTQKPIELLKWLILTYSNENDIVLDNCIGCGSTAIACLETNRDYIGFDNGKCENKKSKHYDLYWADIAQERVDNYIKNNS